MNDIALFAFTADIVKKVDTEFKAEVDIEPTLDRAFELFKSIKKKSSINGRSFLLVWNAQLFYIVKRGKEFQIYQLN